MPLSEDVPLTGGSETSIGDMCRIGVITVSDRASRGEYLDEGGPAILQFLAEVLKSPWQAEYRCVPDDIEMLQHTLMELIDTKKCDIVVTTGGTGPASSDITPEVTEVVCDRLLPGFGEYMRTISLRFVPTAILSRQLGGIKGKTLIFNLPGRPKSIRETIDEIWRAVPYCVDLLGGPYIECEPQVVDAFRPKSAQRTTDNGRSGQK